MKRLFLLAICALLTSHAFACQVTVFEYPLAKKIVLLDAYGAPLKGASIVVREAFGQIELGTYWGFPIGKIVRRGMTDQSGNLSLRGLQGEKFWVTYDDPKDGETFFLVRHQKLSNSVQLNINRWGGLCYLFDIEHNRTKPPSSYQPIESKNSN